MVRLASTTTLEVHMITIDFTFQTVTPESAEHGDFDSHGFITPGMWKYEGEYERNQWQLGDLRGLVDFAQSLGINTCEGADWAYSVDPDINYATGEDTTYAMHIGGATPSTHNRILRLLCG